MSGKYLVTGGTGFIGSSLVRSLVKRGKSVRIFDNNSRGNIRRIADISADVELFEGDIRNPEVVANACKGIDTVLHLAYVNGTEFFYSKPDLVLDVAVKGMVNVIDACIKEGIKDFVLASSSEVYQVPPGVPTAEEVPLAVPDVLNPRYSYGGGKIICELMAINYGRKYFERTIIFRPHNVYGPDMGWEHVIPQFAMRMKDLRDAHPDGKFDFPIKGNGSATRSFIYIDDFVQGVEILLNKAKGVEIYHVGTMEELTIAQVADEVASCFDSTIRLTYSEVPSGETSRRCPDTKKISSLGFQPGISFQEGVRRTTEWYKNNMHLSRR